MNKSDIQELRSDLEAFRITYNSKYLNQNAPATANDIEELARDVFYVLNSFMDKLESIADQLNED